MNIIGVLNMLGRPKDALDAFALHPKLRNERAYANAIKSCIDIGTEASLDRARAIMQEATRQVPRRDDPHLPWNAACIFALCGDLETARLWVAEVLAISPGTASELIADPELADLNLRPDSLPAVLSQTQKRSALYSEPIVRLALLGR
jgi:hypothetical protein